MTIQDQIKQIAEQYAAKLQHGISARIEEMDADDTSHYLIYRVLGISLEEGRLIDHYQNKGRFLYRYAGGFLQEVTLLCFQQTYPDARAVKIPNLLGSCPKTFEIDCLVGNNAYEIKWRDATTDGDHITKEHSRLQTIVTAGYTPLRLMFFQPNRTQAIRIQGVLRDLYKASNGYYYVGNAAWEHIETQTGVNLYAILEALGSGK